ncbi:hypothetical protein AA14337_0759 [Acetobacter malorum DSM 14337]|uniref:Phage protein n=1 Tax=Acetobacter malorum DSM 14337 TaxID=1307910 RepID=A0ABQ0PS36_9PROT|nr:hypothetical protein [Acetobacter malorum]KXV08733.1 hypothetical protein AD930_03745 [Acetobacter malorum]GBQ77237.1 hypothetical protein AA14337_0759 [Acetobacter malorum DSM 14337]
MIDLTDFERSCLAGIKAYCGAGQRAVYADPRKVEAASKLASLGLLEAELVAAGVYAYALTPEGLAVVDADEAADEELSHSRPKQ